MVWLRIEQVCIGTVELDSLPPSQDMRSGYVNISLMKLLKHQFPNCWDLQFSPRCEHSAQLLEICCGDANTSCILVQRPKIAITNRSKGVRVSERSPWHTKTARWNSSHDTEPPAAVWYDGVAKKSAHGKSHKKFAHRKKPIIKAHTEKYAHIVVRVRMGVN